MSSRQSNRNPPADRRKHDNAGRRAYGRGQDLPDRLNLVAFSLQRSQRNAIESFQRVLRFIGKPEHAPRAVELIDTDRGPLTEWKCAELVAIERLGCAWNSARLDGQSI